MTSGPSSEPQIRPATPADEAAVRRCVEMAYALYAERIGKPPAPMLDDYTALIASGAVSVATRRTQVVGLIVMWPETDHLYIDNIAVHPDAQGGGIGAALVGFAESRALTENRSEIRLYTNETMSENLNYYPRLGFVETHRATEAGYNRVYYARPVPSPQN